MRGVLVLAVLLIAGQAAAFDMNPIDVDCWGHDFLCKLTKETERLKFPVHETATLLAYDCHEKTANCKGGKANSSAADLHKSGTLRDLVLGSEWNDDPDGLLRQSVTKAEQWYALFKDAKQQAECKKAPADEKCKEVAITQNPMMLYRSHFGDLQFLHAMAATTDEPARETKRKMMAWAKFAYTVYVDEDNLNDKDLSAFPEIAAIINKPGWTVGALFNPVPGGEWKKSLNPLKFGHYESNGMLRTQNNDDIGVEYVALGSLLHMVQDTYSESHAHRERGCNALSSSKGRLELFRNYADQEGDIHGIADVYPEWMKNGELANDNAVWASAKIIAFAFAKEPWETVEKFLDTEVLALKEPDRMPEPGNRDCFAGKKSKKIAAVNK